MRYVDPGVIPHEICNHEFDSLIQSTNQMNQVVQSTQKSKKSIQIDLINQ